MIWKLKIFFTCQTWPFTIKTVPMKPSTLDHVLYSWYMARFFNSHWHDYSVVDTILQQWLAQFFNSRWHHCSTATGKIFSFFYAGRILQQWCSLLKNRAMYQEYDVWSKVLGFIGTVFIVKSHVWQVKKICSFQSLNPWMTKNTPILNFNFFFWTIVPVSVEQSCQWLLNNGASNCWRIVSTTVE